MEPGKEIYLLANFFRVTLIFSSKEVIINDGIVLGNYNGSFIGAYHCLNMYK